MFHLSLTYEQVAIFDLIRTHTLKLSLISAHKLLIRVVPVKTVDSDQLPSSEFSGSQTLWGFQGNFIENYLNSSASIHPYLKKDHIY